MALTTTTREAFRQEIMERLGDLSNVHWSVAEINYFIGDALRTFGAIANYWKETVAITSVEDEVYYNLNMATRPTGKLSLDLTVAYVLEGLNYNLIESISDATPASQFITLAEILKLIKNKIIEMQLACGLVLTKAVYNLPAPPITEIVLDDVVIDIVRVLYKDDQGTPWVLREDTEDNITQDPNFDSLTRIPKYYTYTLTDTEQKLGIWPPSNVNGTLEILSVNAPTNLVDSTTPILLPNDLIPYIRWGVLADILGKDGLLNDPFRAVYAMTRWQEGVYIGQRYTSILKAYANGRPSSLDSISNLDSQNSKWMTIDRNRATSFGIAGYNMILPNSVPTENEQGWTFNSVINAPIPTADVGEGSFIQVKSEYMDSISNYVYHSLMFKDGIFDLNRTKSFLEQFLTDGIQYNDRLDNRGAFKALLGRTKIQEDDKEKIVVASPYGG